MSDQGVRPLKGSNPRPQFIGGGASTVSITPGSSSEVEATGTPDDAGAPVALLTQVTGEEILFELKKLNVYMEIIVNGICQQS